ncbi:MAG: right-handed parallel beta-helix repeat-containing protein [Chitinispirillaceae bacterium]|nr:right-handed parallel beta-helix repeat-containing protein [Chitinispirillaceae bacterium]
MHIKTAFMGTVLAAFSLHLQPGFAAVYSVGPGKPYTQLQNVVSLLRAGDTVLVDGNTTYAGGVAFTRAGTAAQKIVILGVRISGNRPVLSGGTNTIHFNGSHHLVFEGFEVTGGTFRGIFHQADSVVVRDVLVHHCPAHGILGADQGSGTLLLEYSEVHHCGSGSSQHQIYMTTDEVHFPGRVFRMQFCYVHDATGGNNVKSRSERNEIYYNWIEGAYYHELELIGPDPGGVAGGWTPRLKREDSDVAGNVLFKRQTAANNDPDFAVTRIGGDATGETHGRYRFVNNTVVSGSGAVFRMFDSLESVEMHNNVFYRSGGGVTLVRTVEALWTTGAPRISGTNNWVVTGTAAVPAGWRNTRSGTVPGFADFAGNNLHPLPASPLRDSGSASPSSADTFSFPRPLFPPAFHPPAARGLLPGGAPARSSDGAIDIGAFEYAALEVMRQERLEGKGQGVGIEAIRREQGAVTVRFLPGRVGAAVIRVSDIRGRILGVVAAEVMPSGVRSVTIGSPDGRFASAVLIIEIRAGGGRFVYRMPGVNG